MTELSTSTLAKLAALTNDYPKNATTEERIDYALDELETLIEAIRAELFNADSAGKSSQQFAQGLFCQLDCLIENARIDYSCQK